IAAAIAVEPLEIEPERLGTLPEVWVLESPLIGEQEVVHLPEAALQASRLSRAGRRPGAGVAGADREVAKHAPSRGLRETRAERGAERALKVGVLDDEQAILGSPDVVIRRDAGDRRRP